MKTSFVKLLSGKEAIHALEKANFEAQWLQLFDECSYSTVFQHPSFVKTWYTTYATHWEPIILFSQNKNRELNGLWFLAYNKATRKLEHAGTNQAEYQVWLTSKGEELSFFLQAWRCLCSNIDFDELQLKYLPDVSLFETLKSSPEAKKYIIGKSFDRPWLTIKQETLTDLFSKRTRKKINQFNKIGRIEFKRIETIEDFDEILDKIISLYNYRMAVTKGIVPFGPDNLKRQFHRNLFLSAPKNLILTVTFIDGQPVAGEFAGFAKGIMHLYLGMHSPFLNEYSPGFMHLIQLCRYAEQENIAKIDLTPGGDSWKERFASESDQVVYAVLYKSKLSKIRAQLKRNLEQIAKTVLSKIGLKAKIDYITKHLRSVAKAKNTSKDQRLELFECALQQPQHPSQNKKTFKLQENSIADLLLYKPNESISARCEFLSNTYQYIEVGATSYSVSNDHCLLANVWVLKNKQFFKINNTEYTGLSPENTTLVGLYFDEKALPESDAKEILNMFVEKSLHSAEKQTVYALVEPRNRLVMNAMESLGFNQKTS